MRVLRLCNEVVVQVDVCNGVHALSDQVDLLLRTVCEPGCQDVVLNIWLDASGQESPHTLHRQAIHSVDTIRSADDYVRGSGRQ